MSLGFATCAKLFNYPDEPGAAGTRLVPEVVDTFTVSKDGRTYTFELKRTFRFHTGAPVTAQSFADAFNRVAQPKLGSPATRYMREIVGAAAVIDGKATLDLRRPRARPLSAADPADQAARRLHRPADACRSSARSCPTHRSIRRDRRPARVGPVLRRRAGRQPADRAETQPLLPRRSSRERRPGRLDDRPSGDLCRSPPSRTGSTTATSAASPGRSGGSPRGTASTGPAGSSSSARGSRPRFVAFNHDSAARSTGRARSRSRRRSTTRSTDRSWRATYGYLAGKRTDQMLPPALARTASIYPLEGADVGTARKWLATRADQADRARSLRGQLSGQCRGRPGTRLQPETDRHRCRGQVLRHHGSPREGWQPAGSRSTSPSTAGSPTTPIRPASSSRCSPAGAATSGVNLDDPRINARIDGGEPPDRRRRGARPGPTSTST